MCHSYLSIMPCSSIMILCHALQNRKQNQISRLQMTGSVIRNHCKGGGGEVRSGDPCGRPGRGLCLGETMPGPLLPPSLGYAALETLCRHHLQILFQD